MKIRKTAKQKNVRLDMDSYNGTECMELLDSGIAWFFDDDARRAGDPYDMWYSSDSRRWREYYPDSEHPWRHAELHIDTSELEEIKVILVDGFYRPAGVGKDGTVYHIDIG